MNFNIPSHVSPKTILRAKRLADNATSIDLYPGIARWNDSGDYMWFVFTNKHSHIVLLFCTPTCYLLEHHTDDDCGNMYTEFSMVKNIRHQLMKLKRNGFHEAENIEKLDN